MRLETFKVFLRVMNEVQCITIVKSKANSTLEQQCKDHETRDRLLISKIKVLPINPVFSNWVNFYKKKRLL